MDKYVSRDDVRRFIADAFSENRFATNYDYAILVDKIDELPAADVQLMKHGRWIDSTFYDPCEKSWEQDFEFECSNCGHKIYNKPNDDNLFCGHCGARIDLKDDDTNG